MKEQLERINHTINEIDEMLDVIKNHIKEALFMTKQKNSNNQPVSVEYIKTVFGSFDYEETFNGKIKILGNWERENCKLYQFQDRKFYLHKLVAPQFFGALVESYSSGLEDETQWGKGGGIFCPRYQLYNADNPLSFHAFAVAVDFLPDKYPRGSNEKPPERFIEIWERWGWYWGGRFSTPDSHHWEWCRFVI